MDLLELYGKRAISFLVALWQMQSGHKLWKENYGTKDYLVPYWIWILILSNGLIRYLLFGNDPRTSQRTVVLEILLTTLTLCNQ